MLRTTFLLTLMTLIALLWTPALHADSSGNIGLNFSEVIEEQGLDLIGEYKYEGDGFDFEVDGLLQKGDLIRGKAHAELTFNVLDRLGLKVITDTTAKGYTVDTLGRDTNAFLALNVPNVAVAGLDIDIGIGGKQAAPWGAPNALADLVDKGYDEEVLEPLGLADISPAPKGVQFQEGAFLQAYLATDISDWLNLQSIIQLSGENKAHQFKARADWSMPLIGGITGNIGAEIIAVHQNKTVTYDRAIFIGGGYQWE